MKTIKLSQLKADFSTNVRFESNYGDVSELAENILQKGILVPLMVEKKGSEYFVISGHRRYSALQILLESGAIEPNYNVPVTINEFADEIERSAAKLLGNDSQAITPDEWFAEIARLVESLMQTKGKDEAIQDVSKALGKKITYVSNAYETWIKMDSEARELIHKGKVGVTLASVLAKKALNANLASLGAKFAVVLQEAAKDKGVNTSQESLGEAIVQTQKQVIEAAKKGEEVEEEAIGAIALNNLIAINANKEKAAAVKKQKVVFMDSSPVFNSGELYNMLVQVRDEMKGEDSPEIREFAHMLIEQCDSGEFNLREIKNRFFKNVKTA